MVNVFKTKLDIKTPIHSFKPRVVQYDHVRLEIELLDGGLPYNLTDVSRVEFTHVRRDGAVVIHPGAIETIGGKRVITYEYQGTEMDLTGAVKASFALFDADDRKVSSHKFEVVVEKDLREETFNPAEPNHGLLQTLIADVKYVKENGGSGGIGPQGPPGRDGRDGIDGYTPVKGVDYFDGKDGKDGRDGRDGYTPVKGVDYLDGKDGVDGYTPIKGVDYFDGINGQNGFDGKSAYEIAIDNGFVGTEAEWLLSLKGERGEKGEPGSGGGNGNGQDGIDGKSAFEIAVENGFIGTETEWLESLKGEQGPPGVRGLTGEPGYTPQKNIDYFDGQDGADGTNGIDGKSAYQIAVSNGFSGTETAWLTSLKGAKGDTGLTGPPGSDASVTSANITTALGYTPIKASDVTWANVLSKPSTFTPSAHTHLWADITDKPTAFDPSSHSHAWTDITGKPSTFAPNTHTHSYNDLTNKPNIPTLNNTVTSTSTSEAATANSVKTAYDLAATKASTNVATTSANGLMSSSDKTKLDSVATNANNYTHPTGDGNLHVPATSTTNNGKVLKAGSTAGSVSWGSVTASEVGLGNVTNESKAAMFTSPTFTGIPTAPTATTGTNTTQIATTAFVKVANDAHKTESAPHQYGGKFEWRYNATTNSLDLVVLS